MKYMTLEYIKAHSRIDSNTEDSVLEEIGTAAENAVMKFLNRGTTTDQAIANIVEEYGEIPADIILATQMLTDTFYQHRSQVSQNAMSYVPYTFDVLIKPYMIL